MNTKKYASAVFYLLAVEVVPLNEHTVGPILGYEVYCVALGCGDSLIIGSDLTNGSG